MSIAIFADGFAYNFGFTAGQAANMDAPTAA